MLLQRERERERERERIFFEIRKKIQLERIQFNSKWTKIETKKNLVFLLNIECATCPECTDVGIKSSPIFSKSCPKN